MSRRCFQYPPYIPCIVSPFPLKPLFLSSIYSWRHLKLFGSRYKIIRAAAGRSHTVVVTDDGQSFAFGWNKHGQLGIGSTKNGEPLSYPLYSLPCLFLTHLHQRKRFYLYSKCCCLSCMNIM